VQQDDGRPRGVALLGVEQAHAGGEAHRGEARPVGRRGERGRRGTGGEQRGAGEERRTTGGWPAARRTSGERAESIGRHGIGASRRRVSGARTVPGRVVRSLSA